MPANDQPVDNLSPRSRYLLLPRATSLRWLNVQGYQNCTLAQRGAISLGLRLTTGLCTLTFLAVLAAGATSVLWVLAGIALSAFVTPRHPFDAAWQYGARHLVGGPPLPRNPIERRMAFLVAGTWLLVVAALFALGWQLAAYIAAAAMLAACVSVTAVHFCVPGTAIALIRGRIGLLTQEIPTE